MNLVFVFLISKVQSESIHIEEPDLQERAIGWRRRKQAGFQDSLLLVGEEFQSEGEFKAFLEPYGLADADLAVIQDAYDEVRGELMESVVEPWLSEKHPGAVGFIEWSKYCEPDSYPLDGWWWTGVEAYAEELSSVYGRMAKFVPYDFKTQVSTWLAFVLEDRVKWLFENDAEDFEVCMLAISLSRWLTGFDAITGNNFYDFSYHDAAAEFLINPFRLGLEAGQASSNDLLEELLSEETSDDELPAILLRHCLSVRNHGAEIPSSLKRAFGSDTALLWGAYSSIWPNLRKSMAEAANDLISLGQILDVGDLMKIYQFVCDGWGDEF